MVQGDVYYAPYNKADLEDLSWNLNGLKMGGPDWNETTSITFAGNAPLWKDNDHARQSQIAANNAREGALPNPVTNRIAPYKYNAVFNKGSVLYQFMNKGLGGAKVDLVIYRVKKTSSASLNYDGAYLGTNTGVPMDRITHSIGEGYMNHALAKGATDALGGRPPEADDISINPSFPFLPELRKTQQSQLPFAEVARQTFAMPSGSRREVNVVLPGAVYDPCNIPTAMSLLASTSDAYPQVFDEGTFCVVMSVSGQKCTQELTEGPTTGYYIGDMYAGADVQYYATYQECMGACQYKDPPAAQIYTGGALIVPADVPSALRHVPITMLPQNQAVRLPATVSGIGGNQLSSQIIPTPAP
jgi:hypothetical protein